MATPGTPGTSSTPPVETTHASFAAALLAAQRLANPVAHDAQNSHQKYLYTSAEAIIDHARQCLNQAGLTVRRGEYRIEPGTPPMLLQEFRCEHESGEGIHVQMPWPILERTGTPMDKALAGALTSSLSYMLRDLLLIPRPDEDIQGRDDSKHQPQAKDRQSPTPAAQPEQSLSGRELMIAAVVREGDGQKPDGTSYTKWSIQPVAGPPLVTFDDDLADRCHQYMQSKKAVALHWKENTRAGRLLKQVGEADQQPPPPTEAPKRQAPPVPPATPSAPPTEQHCELAIIDVTARTHDNSGRPLAVDGKPVTAYTIRTSDAGNRYGTFDDAVAGQARDASGTGEMVRVTFVETSRGRKVTLIERIHQAPPTSGEDIPF